MANGGVSFDSPSPMGGDGVRSVWSPQAKRRVVVEDEGLAPKRTSMQPSKSASQLINGGGGGGDGGGAAANGGMDPTIHAMLAKILAQQKALTSQVAKLEQRVGVIGDAVL